MSRQETLNIFIGSCCVAFAQILFGTNDAIVKICGLCESQILFGRFLIPFLVATVWWNIKKPVNGYAEYHKNWYGDTPYKLNIWTRGFTFFVMMASYYYGIVRIPIGDAASIAYQSPLITIFGAAIFLGETLPKTFILIPSVIMIIIGVFLISQPQFLYQFYNLIYKIDDDEYEPLDITGIIFILISTLSMAITNILTRRAVPAHFLQIVFSTSSQSVFIWIPLIVGLNELFIHDDQYYAKWEYTFYALSIMFIVGCIGVGSIVFFVIGYQYAEASKVAWLEYLSIIVSVLYQIFLFHDPPNTFEIIGTIMVCLSCLLPLLHELLIYYTSTKGNKIIYHVQKNEMDIDDHKSDDDDTDAQNE